MKIPFFLMRLAAPKNAYDFSQRMIRWLFIPTIFILFWGLLGGLYLAPADYQQGDGFRIMYVHVPCALLSLSIYAAMASAAIFAFIWRIKIYDYFIASCAPVGALVTALALITGSLWGKPMWGTYWVWDARLTAELIQFFLYLGVISLSQTLHDYEQGHALIRILVIIGFINLPIIHFSVYWWNTLHQADTLKFFGPSLIAPSMLHPLLWMILGMSLSTALLIALRFQTEVLVQEKQTKWVKDLLCLPIK